MRINSTYESDLHFHLASVVAIVAFRPKKTLVVCDSQISRKAMCEAAYRLHPEGQVLATVNTAEEGLELQDWKFPVEPLLTDLPTALSENPNAVWIYEEKAGPRAFHHLLKKGTPIYHSCLIDPASQEIVEKLTGKRHLESGAQLWSSMCWQFGGITYDMEGYKKLSSTWAMWKHLRTLLGAQMQEILGGRRWPVDVKRAMFVGSPEGPFRRVSYCAKVAAPGSIAKKVSDFMSRTEGQTYDQLAIANSELIRSVAGCWGTNLYLPDALTDLIASLPEPCLRQ